MTARFSRNADLHLADALAREIEKTPAGELLAEAAEDFGDRRALVREFDAAFSRAVVRTRRQRIADRLKALVAQVLTPSSWKPAAATAATLLVLVAGGLYVTYRWGVPGAGDRVVLEKGKPAAEELKQLAKAPDHPRGADIIVWKLAQDPELDALHARIGEVHRAGDFAGTKAAAERYLVLARSRYSEEHPSYARGLDELAALHQSRGDYREAEPLLKRSLAIAEKALGPGHLEVANGLSRLAGLYESQGQYAKAREWFEKAAAAGHAGAMGNLGRLYAEGHGAPRDYARAREWFEKAAAAGDRSAMGELGMLYANGHGVPRDYAKAREWYEKAAAAGNAEALGKLSRYALFAREFAQALDAAERALKADPELLWIAANRAHALMYLGRAAEAREAYLMHKDKRILKNENKTRRQVIAEDFDELRKAGLDHPQMAEIEGALGIAGQVWKAQSGNMVAVRLLAVLSGHAFEVDRCAFSPDGRRLATASGGTVRVWDVPSTYAIHEYKVLFLPPITALAFGPDNVEIFTVDGNDKHVVSLRDTHELLIKYFPSFQSKVLSAVPTPEGLYVVTAADDNGVRLFKDNKEIRAFRGHDGPVRSAALSPDRKLILTTSDDKTVRVWNAETGEQVAVLGDRMSSIAYAAFSPDGRRVIAISRQDPIAQVWDVATRAQLTVLKGHTGSVLHAAFSPDGRQVMTASADGTARLWKVEGGEAVATFAGHAGPVTSIAFSPDGSMVATTSQDKTARLWRVQQ